MARARETISAVFASSGPNRAGSSSIRNSSGSYEVPRVRSKWAQDASRARPPSPAQQPPSPLPQTRPAPVDEENFVDRASVFPREPRLLPEVHHAQPDFPLFQGPGDAASEGLCGGRIDGGKESGRLSVPEDGGDFLQRGGGQVRHLPLGGRSHDEGGKSSDLLERELTVPGRLLGDGCGRFSHVIPPPGIPVRDTTIAKGPC